MANECDNRLTITALEGESLPAGLMDIITDENGNLSLDKAVPVPDELEGMDMFDWMIGNWGTDGVYPDSYVQQVDDEVQVSCDTRWSPLIAWTLKLSELFPTARFSLMYLEPGVGFGGELVAVAGKVEHQVQEDEVTFERWVLMGWMLDDFIESYVEDAAELDCIIDDPSVSDNILNELLDYEGDEPALTEDQIHRIEERLNVCASGHLKADLKSCCLFDEIIVM